MKKILISFVIITLILQPLHVFGAIPDDEKPFEFKENDKFKDKPKKVTVPKRVPAVPGPAGILTTVFGMTPLGNEFINEGAELLTNVDYYLWDNLNMEHWPGAISDGIITIGEELGNGISDLLGAFRDEHYPEIHVTAFDGKYYPELSALLTNAINSPGAQNGLYFLGPIYFITISNPDTVYAMRGFVYKNSNNNRYYGGFVNTINGSRTELRDSSRFGTNDDALQRAINYASDYTNMYDSYNTHSITSSTKFFAQIDDAASAYSDYPNARRENFPIQPDTHFPLIPESLPNVQGKPEIEQIDILEIGTVPHIGVHLPNPWHDPNITTDPLSNPEHLPFYTPLEVSNPSVQPEWEPLYIPLDANGNPMEIPNANPNANPNPNPNPGEGSNIVPPGSPPPTNGINFPKLQKSILGVTYVFPFSLPWDAGRAFDSIFSGFGNERPEWELPILLNDKTENIKIGIPELIYDWLPFMHGLQIIVFDIGIIYAIRKWFGGTT